ELLPQRVDFAVELFRAREPASSLLFHGFPDDRPDLFRDAVGRVGHRKGKGVLEEVRGEELAGRLAGERKLSRQELVEGDPERVEVAPAVERLALGEPTELLGRRLFELSEEDAG